MLTTRVTVAVRKNHSSCIIQRHHNRTVEGASFDHHQHEFFRNKDLFTRLIPTLFEALPLPYNAIPQGIVKATTHTTAPNSFKHSSTFAMVLSYNGIHFPGGYEHNPNLSVDQQPTVRGILTQRLAKVLKKKTDHKLHISTAGRTDAFVSAKSALCSFTTPTLLIAAAATAFQDAPQKIEHHDWPWNVLRKRLNEESENNDIIVHSILPVSSSFHATFSTKSREYIYVLPFYSSSQDISETLLQSFVADKLLAALQGLPLDYFAFSSGKVKTATTVCTIRQAGCWMYNSTGACVYNSSSVGAKTPHEEVIHGFGDTWKKVLLQEHQQPCCCFVFKLKSDRFLRRMIRKLINALLQETTSVIDKYKTSSSCADEIYRKEDEWKNRLILRLEQKDRSNNPPASPLGLCLWRIEV